MADKKRILILIESFTPGFKNGGHGRSIRNLIDFYHEDYDFYVYTSDRDIGDSKPYPNIISKQWLSVDNAKVSYTNSLRLWLSLHKVIQANQFDIIFACGFFSNYTLRIMIDKFMNRIHIPIIVAPMGQFSIGALGFKSKIKKTILYFVNKLHLLNDIHLSVSSLQESLDTKKVLKNIEPLINEDLPSKKIISLNHPISKKTGSLRVIYLSRIHPMKNLEYAIDLLKVLNADIVFDIYGPIEDTVYFNQIMEKIKCLPLNIVVQYKGEVKPQDTMSVFSKYHVFLFPTLGENFGHVIYESLAAMCIPIISTNTPWNDLEFYSCGYTIPLEQKDRYTNVINALADMDIKQFQTFRRNAYYYAEKKANEIFELKSFKKMIESVESK